MVCVVIGSSVSILVQTSGSRAGNFSPLAVVFVFFLGSRIVDLDARAIAQVGERFVAAGNDFIAFFESIDDFDFSVTCDAGMDGGKDCGTAASYAMDHKDAFKFRVWLAGSWRGSGGVFAVGGLVKIRLAADRERLNWNRNSIGFAGGGDSGSCGKPRP